MGCDLSIAKERLNAPVHHFCQRLNVRFVSIATDLVRLTGDVDFYRTLHSRCDNIERSANVKVSCHSAVTRCNTMARCRPWPSDKSCRFLDYYVICITYFSFVKLLRPSLVT